MYINSPLLYFIFIYLLIYLSQNIICRKFKNKINMNKINNGWSLKEYENKIIY